MTDYVRIKDPSSGAEYTYDLAKVEALGLEEYVVEKPALGRDGLPAPAKTHVPLGQTLPGSEQDRRNQPSEQNRVLLAEPPRGGEGSGLEPWTAYAEGLEVEVPEGATRDEIIQLVEAYTANNQTPGANTPGQDAGQPSAEERN